MELAIPVFIAGILTFLAPCTLPLVPAYLSFISGVALDDAKKAKFKIFCNGLFYVIGFSAIFILLGSLFGLGGAFLFKYKIWLSRIGGIFVIIFGLYMLKAIKLPSFGISIQGLPSLKKLSPGKPLSAFILGAAFATGWTPCVGPILGSVLFLASTGGTVAKGSLLLFIFSLGLAIPFLTIALSFSWASQYIKKITKYLNIISIIGGVFLITIGILLITDSFGIWISFFYKIFSFIKYDKLLNYF